MVEKAFVQKEGKQVARVTFVVPNSTWADAVHLVGDFNQWSRTSHPFRRDREGHWRLTADLDVGRAYQFRYLRDGEVWMNDNQADAYVANPYGSDNSVVITDPAFVPHYDKEDRVHQPM